ncbi:tail fibers protein [Escherichia phage TM1]|uniref:Tail fibers protein n=1 Tax=Escherichia phage TM1 TaxID=2762279 RepID=A0ABY4XTD2_9CAUD|nr:tail fibers protein [Escherichia phage TM1]
MSTITQFPSGNTRYRIEFDYLARTFVVVTLVNSSNPALNRVLEVGRDYRFLNPTMIEMLADQSGFDVVRIHRQTGTDLVVDFRNGSVLTASDLTNSELQAIHIAEEGRDQTVDLAKEYADAAGNSAGSAKDSEDEARRIVSSIREAGLIGYITRSSFEKGFTVTLWNEVLLREEDGYYYRWDGALPKTVPAGSTPDSNWTNVGKLDGLDEHSPENFGAIPNDPSFDCLPAIKLAIATGTLNLDGKATYHVTDEVVIPSYLRGNLNGATIKAIGPTWPALKSVVRVSKFPIGTKTVDVANTENQVRGLRLIGSLNIDCADIASYGFYARLMCAESEMGSIYAYNANRYGIVMFACWYFQMGTLHANNCARGMALGYSTEGEQGDTYVNATHFPHISAWGTDKSTGLGYDPITDDASKYTIGAGIILGRGLSTSVGVICSENTSGAGVVTMDPAAWDIGVMYCEGNSKDFTQVGEPKVSLLSSKANSESHTLTISTLHLSAGCGILTRSNQERVLIRSLYRFDNSRTFHSYCTADTVEVGSSNYYVLNGHNYNAPAALIKEPLNVDFVRSGLTLSEWTTTVIGHFAGSTAEQQLYVKLPASPSGLDLQIASEEGTEYITVTGTDFKASLTKKRLPSKLYEIRIGGVSTVPVADCSVLIRSRKGDWYYW